MHIGYSNYDEKSIIFDTKLESFIKIIVKCITVLRKSRYLKYTMQIENKL